MGVLGIKKFENLDDPTFDENVSKFHESSKELKVIYIFEQILVKVIFFIIIHLNMCNVFVFCLFTFFFF